MYGRSPLRHRRIYRMMGTTTLHLLLGEHLFCDSDIGGEGVQKRKLSVDSLDSFRQQPKIDDPQVMPSFNWMSQHEDAGLRPHTEIGRDTAPFPQQKDGPNV